MLKFRIKYMRFENIVKITNKYNSWDKWDSVFWDGTFLVHTLVAERRVGG
jgi:hypothetical protein